MTTRVPAAAIALGGLAMAALPALPWYVVRVGRREIDASGIATAGELWLLPLLGIAALLAGLSLSAGRTPAGSHRARVLACVAALAGAGGGLAALAAALDPPVRLLVPGVEDAVAAPVALAPAAYLTPTACAAVLVAAVVIARVRVPWDRVRDHLRSPRRR